MHSISDDNTTSNNRRLFRALEYVSDQWMPCDQNLLDKIIQLLNDQHADHETAVRVMSLIQSDVALYLYTLRKFYQMLAEEGIPIDEELSAHDFILEGGVELLRLIFNDHRKLQTAHSLATADDAQRLRVFEAVVSAAGAQTMAPTFGIESYDGYSGALVRQLGLLLIAWNYPTIYAQALRVQREGGSLVDVIQEKLGFSPELLTIELLHSWGVSRRVSQHVYGLGAKNAIIANQTIAKLYSTSEALARANIPEIYPTARADWGVACTEILSRLGGAGFEAIQSSLEEHLAHYKKNIPGLFNASMVLDPRARLAAVERSRAIDGNPYVPLCDHAIKSAFERIYAAVDPNGNQQQILKDILHQVVPQAGFGRGCVYTVDPERMRLFPQTAIGKGKRSEFLPCDLSLSTQANDIVALAYHSAQPIIEYRIADDGSCINKIAGFIGLDHRLGVLYLEIDGEEYDRNATLVLNQFRAIQRALSDCLG